MAATIAVERNNRMAPAGSADWLKATRKFWNTDSAFEAKYRRILSDPEIDATTDAVVLRRLWEKRTEEELPHLLEGIPLRRDWTSLEIGCGIGRLLRPIAAQCQRVIGIDLSENMIS
ncbi:MAG: methyltransferase domain-containing protein, partial [Chloroflexi bacterium]|nr:methyltransferase domain-containing protein [Chloroflexota bacterium]